MKPKSYKIIDLEKGRIMGNYSELACKNFFKLKMNIPDPTNRRGRNVQRYFYPDQVIDKLKNDAPKEFKIEFLQALYWNENQAMPSEEWIKEKLSEMFMTKSQDEKSAKAIEEATEKIEEIKNRNIEPEAGKRNHKRGRTRSSSRSKENKKANQKAKSRKTITTKKIF